MLICVTFCVCVCVCVCVFSLIYYPVPLFTSVSMFSFSYYYSYFFIFLHVESEVAQSCLTLCDPMDSSLPDSSVHGLSQARILEWVAISFSRVSSQPRDQTQVSCIVGRRFYHLSHQGSLFCMLST